MRQALLPAGATRVISSQTGAEYESGAQLRNTPYNPDVEVTDSRENSETAPRRSTGLAAQEPHTGGNKTRKAGGYWHACCRGGDKRRRGQSGLA